MTAEQSVIVAVPRTAALRDLVRDIVSAAQRSEKADPGDRADVVRYEALCVRLEGHAEDAVRSGAQHEVMPSLLLSGVGYAFEDELIVDDPARLSARVPEDVAQTVRKWAVESTVVELRRALELGATRVDSEHTQAPDPAEPWEAEDDAVGSRAVEQRFRSQLGAAVERTAERVDTRGDSINPSGVNNRIITMTLRDFVVGSPTTRVDTNVVYRDGSEASYPFPLRCLPLCETLPDATPDLELHLALLSIRHTEMDPVVDGAFLRNAEVSRPRPAALTDDFVYETARTQLSYLTDDGRLAVRLHVYQTGLDTAIVGFYRAVVDHLLEHPYSLSVVPMFFSSSQQKSGVDEATKFRPGLPWTLGDR